MSITDSTNSPNWYWSQRGTSMGPVDFDEIRRLFVAGSITPMSWIYHPQQGAWVQASTIPELMDAAPRPATGVPPDAPLPEIVYCRFCGASAAPTAVHCSACSRPMATAGGAGLDLRTAIVLCRASVLANVAIPFLSILGPAIVWAVAPNDARIVREAKACLNCHLTLLIAGFAAGFIGIVGLLCLVGPLIAAAIGVGLWIYALVVGIRGLIAAGNDAPYEYPLALRIFT